MPVRQSSIPWLTSDIKNVMKDRDYHKNYAVKYARWSVARAFPPKYLSKLGVLGHRQK